MNARLSRHVARGLAGVFLLFGCENDVSVRLLPKPQVTPEPKPEPEPGPEPQPEPEPEPECLPGDPCSGLARALYFKGPYDRVEIAASSLLDVPQDFAIEAWVLLKSHGGGHGIFNRWAAGVGDLQLTLGAPEPLPQLELPTSEPVPSHVLATWAFVRPELWLTVVAPSPPGIDSWHHLATSYGGGSFRLYVDGSLQASMDAIDTVANAPSPLYLGATARNERGYLGEQGPLWWPPIDGFIAEVRISSTNRYAADFVPEARLNADTATIALWHLDEGSGSLASDSGPSQLSGSIVGASWAFAPVRLQPSP